MLQLSSMMVELIATVAIETCPFATTPATLNIFIKRFTFDATTRQTIKCRNNLEVLPTLKLKNINVSFDNNIVDIIFLIRMSLKPINCILLLVDRILDTIFHMEMLVAIIGIALMIVL